MPKAAPAAGTGTPVSGDHSNATEIAAPVVEEEGIDTPLGNPDELGSHRDDADTNDVDETEEESSEEEVVVPARLKGKPLAQVYKEFAGLEADRSRLGNELGEARALLREALAAALKHPGAKSAQETEDEPDPTADEFLEDPKSATDKLVAKKLKPLQQALLTAEQKALMLEFETRRPGYQEEAASPEFQEWVKASPYRARMFQQAAKFDMEAAEDLYAMWDEQKTKTAGEGDESPAEKKKAAIKRATTETGGSGKAVSGKSGKKIYKSTELARLYVQDRERYNEMAEEIQAAFAEGRVR